MPGRYGWKSSRGNTTVRGYGSSHQALRRQWKPQVEAGRVRCWRCGRTIIPGTDWHLGHDDHDRSIYRGPEHKRCNLKGASQEANRRRTNHIPKGRGRLRDLAAWASGPGGAA